MNTDIEKPLNIGITDFDNRWNKVAAEIARPYLTGSASPAVNHDKPDGNEQNETSVFGSRNQD